MKELVVLPNITIKQALKKLSKGGEKCLVVVDKNNTLLGTLSDGDLRKTILKGSRISDSITSVYQSKPTVLVKGNYRLGQAKDLFIKKKYDLIPIIDNKGKLIDILVWEKVFKNGIGIINISRSIIYAGNGSINDISEAALNYTKKIRSFL